MTAHVSRLGRFDSKTVSLTVRGSGSAAVWSLRRAKARQDERRQPAVVSCDHTRSPLRDSSSGGGGRRRRGGGVGGGGGGGVRTEAVATQKGVCRCGGVLEADTTKGFKGFSRVLLSFLPLSSIVIYFSLFFSF